jgi:large subunit ribosomal protein L5
MVKNKTSISVHYPRLLKTFKEEISPRLIKENSYTSPMQVPRILKIVLNMGVGQAVNDKKILEKALGDMEKIAGQKTHSY